ncbi:MAG: hypothetical protein J2P44_06900 [Candidatus Dormibacteraeota bacterium]|nr:hypothetical protein [Candidatus Dormibacteraeota bacterium]
MARYLIVANLTAESPTLRDEAARIVVQDPDAVFDVVVPRSGVTPGLALLGGLDSRTLRRTRARRVRERLASVGARAVVVHLAKMEPLDEIDGVLSEGEFKAVIVSTLPHYLSHWLRTDLPGRISRRHPDLQVRVVTAPHELYVESPAG